MISEPVINPSRLCPMGNRLAYVRHNEMGHKEAKGATEK